MGSRKKRLLLFLVEGLVLLLICWPIYTAFHPTPPSLNHIQNNFALDISTEHANQLYNKNTQGWFGDGEIYSVWQYDDSAILEGLLPWQQGKGFRQQLYQQVVSHAQPDSYYLPFESEQEVYYYLQEFGADGYTDNKILIIYAPQIKLGDGLQYKNLLFILEWYS